MRLAIGTQRQLGHRKKRRMFLVQHQVQFLWSDKSNQAKAYWRNDHPKQTRLESFQLQGLYSLMPYRHVT